MRKCPSLYAVLLCSAVLKTFVHCVDDIEEKERYSSSTVGLLKLLRVEEHFVDSLMNKADQLGEHFESLRMYLSSVGYELNRSLNERVVYVSNPINAFSLLRRTHEDLPKWHAYFREAIGKDLSNLDDLVEKLPSDVDILSAMRGIQRIERIYELKIDDLAQGLLQGVQYKVQLTYRDLIAMGNSMYQQRDYQAAAKWYRIACKRELENPEELLIEILGDPSEELHRQYVKSLFIYGSTISEPSKSVEDAFIMLQNSLANASQEELDNIVSELNDAEVEKELYQVKRSASNFEIGCRGLYRQRTNLVCRYKSTANTFLRLAPLKFEEISLDPFIAVYHEVLYDSEIHALKGKSGNMVNGYARQRNGTEIRDTVARYDWWSDTSLTRERINQRIIDMTGFNFTKDEKLQIANYGVGTYFEPHFDYSSDGFETPEVTTLGDRLASIIFYAGEVLQGGATVFPEINVTVFPQKGSMLYWFNLHDDGRPDIRSQHSACPVVNGDRWTLTMWVPIFPQMFSFPCKS
ncbi:prolyl 4-hydroxylase subunit alpha-1 isoform X2 [Drosophila erecta]|uniref:prolyl 4-hydroxylase subunit alpha-1 isoform X2 n=1 Tax=Drosophila erecta TaxID=7220 RepID=UPI00017800BC|nr:prolyl 4-hydroxylase subunit alpha-1 isoform X2 [Drosophila erecta]